MEIPGLPSLLSIYHRNVERTNDVLDQRKQFAAELADNCRKWTTALIEALEEALVRWERDGKDAARREIEKQQEDFQKLNYWSLRQDSPLMRHLDADHRFSKFVGTCSDFYFTALDVKRIAYGQIQKHPNTHVSLETDGIREMVMAWRAQLEQRLSAVEVELMTVRIITPK